MTPHLMLPWVVVTCTEYAIVFAEMHVTLLCSHAYVTILIFNCSLGPGLVPLQDCAIRSGRDCVCIRLFTGGHFIGKVKL